MDYAFKPGIGLGAITFSQTPSEIVETFGKPDLHRTEKGIDCETIYMNYDNLGIHLTFVFIDNHESDLQIHTHKLIYNQQDWYDLKKPELLKVIESLYKEQDLNFQFDYELYEYDTYNEEEYSFEDIGVTVWFKSDKANNICLSVPDKELKTADKVELEYSKELRFVV